MDFVEIINQIGVLFFVLLVGVIVRKLGIVDDNASKHMASLIVKVTAPLLIISSMSRSPHYHHHSLDQYC
jgi:predicted permease